MKNFGKLVCISLFLFLIGSTQAYAGYPDLTVILDDSSVLSAVIVGAYDEETISQSEAQAFSEVIGSLLTSSIGGSLGVEVESAHLTPNELASLGYTNSNDVADLVFNAYQDAGFQFYLFVNIYRVEGFEGYGDNLRLDVWLGDADIGDYVYLASFEIPEAYVSLAAGL